ncbi:FAD-linked oxidase C-terminal domain-containing protein [Streptomyces sp. NPDC002795]|uniref:FAD-linked oxidase C-terminal domain-containing protein n=1 Tax=Streptomyces sp. NPDC002795 TaxID=3364665 RepID=UPI0036AF2BB4
MSATARTPSAPPVASPHTYGRPGHRPIELGHYGDGGIHLILPLPERVAADRATVDALRLFVYDIVVREHGGTFSAEHGVGPKNQDAYLRYVPQQVRTVAQLLKKQFDPHDVLGSVSLG